MQALSQGPLDGLWMSEMWGLSQDAHKKPGLSISHTEQMCDPLVVQRPGSHISATSCRGGS